MAIATLTVDLVAKLAKFEADMGRATHIVERSANKLTGAFKGIGAGLSFGAIVAGFDRLIDSAAALDDMAEKTGASVEQLSKLERVAKVSGTSLDTVEMSLVRLAKALHSTDEESKGADKALKAIGLSVDELKGLDTGAALQKVAEALAKYEDGAGKTAIALDLLGKSGAQALPYLKDLAEAGEINATLTAEQAAAAEKFQKAFNRVGSVATENARAFAVELLPAISRVGDGIQGLVRLAEVAGKALAVLAHGAALIRLPFAESPADAKRMLAEFDAIRKLAADDLDEIVMRPLFSSQAQLPAPAASKLSSLSGYTSKAGKDKKTTDRSVDDLESRLAQRVGGAINDSDLAKAQEFALTIERLDKLFFDAGLDADVYASALDKLTGRHAETGKSAERLAELLAATPTAKIEEARADMILLAEAFEQGKLSAEGFSEAARTRLGTLDDGLKQTKSLAEELGLTFTSAFEDAVISGEKVSVVLKGLAQDVARIFLRKSFTEPLGKWFSDLDFSKLFSKNAAGGVYKSPSLSAYSGQVYDTPRLFAFARGAGIFGEAGAEAIMPLKRGSDGKLGVAASGGGVTVTIINQTQAKVTARESLVDGKRELMVLVQDTVTALLGGGALDGAMRQNFGAGRVGVLRG
jgi:hypothetical protein